MPKHLQRDLESLSRMIMDLGGRVEQAIDKAVTALIERDSELAAEVIAGDDMIDDCELGVEEDCLKILALHQPVAADLRFVVAVLKVNNDLERMGDLAAGIASRAGYLATREPIESSREIAGMAVQVRRMTGLALDSLVKRDTRLAHEVCLMDDSVDDIHENMFILLQKHMEKDSGAVKRAVQTLSVSRNLERIADLATNVAQDLIFMVDGEVIRHRIRPISD